MTGDVEVPEAGVRGAAPQDNSPSVGGGEGPNTAGPSDALSEAFCRLRGDDRALAAALDGIFTVLLDEAHRSSRVRRALKEACSRAASVDRESGRSPERTGTKSNSTKRPHRRRPSPWDPFEVYRDSGVDGLRLQLAELDLEQLRDIVAEHGMDTDRLAMKWRDKQRVIGRIVERVEDRTAKGASFRG